MADEMRGRMAQSQLVKMRVGVVNVDAVLALHEAVRMSDELLRQNPGCAFCLKLCRQLAKAVSGLGAYTVMCNDSGRN